MARDIPGMAKYHIIQARRSMEQAGFVYFNASWFAKGFEDDGDGLVHISGEFVNDDGTVKSAARWTEGE